MRSMRLLFALLGLASTAYAQTRTPGTSLTSCSFQKLKAAAPTCDDSDLPMCDGRPTAFTADCCFVGCKALLECATPELIPECEGLAVPKHEWETGCLSCSRARECTTTLAEIPDCDGTEEPVKGLDGCPSCKPAVCDFTTVRVCEFGEDPIRDPATNCPSCKAPECTRELYEALPICTLDIAPTRDSTGCPPCKAAPTCTTDLSILPMCDAGIRPTIVDGCPTDCKPTKCTKLPDEIAPCAADANPEKGEDGCPTCKIVCALSTLPRCEEGIRPVWESHCPSCITAFECTIRPAEWPECLPGEAPVRDESSGCPSCRPPLEAICTKTPEEIPVCSDARPVMGADNCPSCRPEGGRLEGADCTREQFEKCNEVIASGGLQECAVGERPERDAANCCLTCVAPKPMCTEEQKMRCMERQETLPDCASREEMEVSYDPLTCCSSCKRPAPVDAERPAADGTCTVEATREAILRVPVCQDDEEATRSPDHCVPSCTRPERQCTQEGVAECRANTPACDLDERPQFVRGECCPSCAAPRPVCDPVCTDTEVCGARDRDSASKCVKKRVIKTVLKITDDARRERVMALSDVETGELIREVVKRFCDRTENLERCIKYKEMVLSSLTCTKPRVSPGSDDEVEVDISVTSEEITQRRRLLQTTDTPDSLLDAALVDADAAAGMVGSSADTTGTTATPDGSTGGSTAAPGGSTAAPGGSTAAPGGTTATPDEGGDLSSASCSAPTMLAVFAAMALSVVRL